MGSPLATLKSKEIGSFLFSEKTFKDKDGNMVHVGLLVAESTNKQFEEIYVTYRDYSGLAWRDTKLAAGDMVSDVADSITHSARRKLDYRYRQKTDMETIQAIGYIVTHPGQSYDAMGAGRCGAVYFLYRHCQLAHGIDSSFDFEHCLDAISLWQST